MERLRDDKKSTCTGGTPQQLKIIEAAHNKGIKVIVTDYLEDSPGKRVADKAFNINIYDIEALMNICKEESVDGGVSCYIDPCQRPYGWLCPSLQETG